MRPRVAPEDNEKRPWQVRSRAIHRPSLPTNLQHPTLDAARAPYGEHRATTSQSSPLSETGLLSVAFIHLRGPSRGGPHR